MALTNGIVDEVCDAFWNSLADFKNTPSTLEESSLRNVMRFEI